MQDQRLPASFADPLAQAGSTYEIGCDHKAFPLGDIPCDDLTAPNIDHQVEVQPDPANGGGQVGDIPAQHLVGTCRSEPRYWARLLRCSGPRPPLWAWP